jgi:hypothetical protein
MKAIFVAICLIPILSLDTIAKQLPLKKEQFRCFVEPSDIILTVIAYQPDCPLEFVKALPIHGVDGGVAQIYQVRNRGAKAIRSFVVCTVTSVGAGSRWGATGKPLREALMPSQLYPRLLEGDTYQIVPLTEELRERHSLRGPMKGVVTFIVAHVEFTDGSAYDAEREYTALQTFYEEQSRSSR